METSVSVMLDQLHEFLTTPADGSRVVMMCGIAGAGKSTLAKAITKQYPGFHRLSIDQLVFEARGICGVDYPRREYQALLDDAEALLEEKFVELLKQKEDVVLDRSFWARKDRERCYELLRRHGAGGRHQLVYLQARKEFLWQRIQTRAKEAKGADNALDISERLLDRYCSGFEAPTPDENPMIVETETSKFQFERD
ncbi:uncharacterized protein PV09_08894 [Verruconis gallopava]|uniref:Zeta toxin domain-containing protein n=1 Tax=Verruconis gallopava TaxID=253628 RepID=A0A0D1ZZL3_9PEZI|nr:uncharacterized protein PV09_08894 [Verruconis gallopava]KIV99474.1 hypothetical protein PV09_08894 [Verruconis gallopava]